MQKLLNLERNDSKLTRTIKKIDFLGEQTQFEVDGNNRYQTVMGAVCSLIIILFITFASLFFLERIINTKSPDINTVNIKEAETRYIDLRKANFYTGIMATGSAGGIVPIDTILTMKGKITRKNFIETDEGIFSHVEFDDFPLEAKPCKEFQEFYSYVQAIGKLGLTLFENGTCFIPSEGQIYAMNGTLISKSEYNLELTIYPCSLPLATDCQPAHVVNQATVILMYPDYELDMSKKDGFETQILAEMVPSHVNTNS